MEAIPETDEELPAMVDVWLALITIKIIGGAESYDCKLPPCPWRGAFMLIIQGLTLNRLQHCNHTRSHQQPDYIDILSTN
jgi:hypothetical protein